MLQILTVLGLLSGAWYLLIVRPQRDRHRRHASVVGQLAPGVHVMTVGGIFGQVSVVEGETAVIEIAPGMHTRVATDGIARIASGAHVAHAVQHISQDTDMHHHHQQHQRQESLPAAPNLPQQPFAAPNTAPAPVIAVRSEYMPEVTLRAQTPMAPPSHQFAPGTPHIDSLGQSSYRVAPPAPSLEARPPVWNPKPWAASPVETTMEVSTHQHAEHAPFTPPVLPHSGERPTYEHYQHYSQSVQPDTSYLAYQQPPVQSLGMQQPAPAQPSYGMQQPAPAQPSYGMQQPAHHAQYPAMQQAPVYAPAPQPMQMQHASSAPIRHAAPTVQYGYSPASHQGSHQDEPQQQPQQRRHSRAPEGMGSSVRMDDPKLRDQAERAHREREELAEEYRRLTAPYVQEASAQPAHPYVQPHAAPGGQLFVHQHAPASTTGFPMPAIVPQVGSHPAAYAPDAQIPRSGIAPQHHHTHPAEAAFTGNDFQRTAPYSVSAPAS